MRGLCVPATAPPGQADQGSTSATEGFLKQNSPLLHRYFFHPFSNAFLDRFLVHFASQLASQNPLKCVKNRCQDAFHLGLHLWIVFWSVLVSNLDPLDRKKHGFPNEEQDLLKNGLSKLTSNFEPILLPT